MKWKAFIFFLLAFSGKMAFAQNSADVVNYINTYKDLAIAEMKRSGIPSAIILAQGIHETEAGKSDLVLKSNNHFGIKCKDNWTGAVVYHDDDARGECFRSYEKPEDSYRDHSDFLRNSSRYSFLFRLDPTDYKAWAYGLRKAGYATNIHYPQILIKLIEDYHLQQYTLIAMGKLIQDDDKPIVKTEENVPAPVGSVTVEAVTKDEAGHLPDSPRYPAGEFTINNSKVLFAKAGTSLLSIAENYNLSLNRLLDFNDMKVENVLMKDQLIFLQRKRKISDNEFHIVKAGETLYDICQAEGVRYESLQEMNQVSNETPLIPGTKIYLRSPAFSGSQHGH